MSETSSTRSFSILSSATLFGIAILCAGAPIKTAADEARLLWSLAPGDRSYLTTDNSQRGLAFNPATTNLILVNRSGGLSLQILSASTGDDIGTLAIDGISGGTFPLNLAGVADDGAIYAANLVVAASSGAPSILKVYRWENESPETVPTIAFEGDPEGVDEVSGLSLNAQRWGDSMDVRGAGANTMIALAARSSAAVAILTTTNGTDFTATIITNAAGGSGSLGVAFGPGNTLYTKSLSTPLQLVRFDLTNRSATLIKQFADPAFPNLITSIGTQSSSNRLAGVAVSTPDTLNIYDITVPTDSPITIAEENFSTDAANLNNTGAVDFGAVQGTNAVFAVDSNNGIIAYLLAPSPPAAPTFQTQPVSQTVLESANVTFSAGAKGAPPFSYQWQLNSNNISGATDASLILTNVNASASGLYRILVSNAGGSIESTNAVLTVNALVRSDLLTPLWKLAPGDRPYLNTDSTQRGLGFDPVTGDLLVVSRTGGNLVVVLDGATGAEKHRMNLDPTIVFGGTLPINMIGVADDGAVYLANLVTDSAAAGLALYRWDDDSTNSIPAVAFLGDPSNGDATAANRRFGDSMDVRGAGANTQILMASRSGAIAAIFTTEDGISFTATTIQTDAAAGDFGLGVAFGDGNTFWGKAPGRPLRLIQFDLANMTGTTVSNYSGTQISSAVASIAYDSTNKFIAGVTLETPDTLRLYGFSDTNDPVLLDQELFSADNANVNGTGAVDFGGGRIYALDSNNGIIALTVATNAGSSGAAAILSGPHGNVANFQFTLTGTVGHSYEVQSTTDFTSWNSVTNINLNASGTVQITDPISSSAAYRFYRAVNH